MTARTPTYLKSRYETGDIPTQSDYEDIFDSYVNLSVSGTQAINSDLSTTGEYSATSVSASRVFGTNVSANNVIANNGTFTTININTVNSTDITTQTVSASSITSNTASFTTLNAVSAAFNNISVSNISNLSTLNSQTVSAATANISTINVQAVSASSANIVGSLLQSVDSSVKAVGSAQSTAKGITAAINLLITVSAGTDDAIRLPGGYPGWTQYIINSTSSTCQVFPPTGGTIDALSPNAAQTLNPLGRMIVHHITSARFFTMRGT